MKRTTGYIIRTGLLERYITLNHVHNIEAIEQILNKAFWNQTRTFN